MNITHDSASEEFKITWNWNRHLNALQAKYQELTDADLKFEIGQEEDLLKRIGTRLNKKRYEVLQIIHEERPRGY